MGVEPGLVSAGELVVVVSAAFECGDAAGVGSELLGGLGDGDVGVLTSAAEPGAVRGWWRVGQQSVDLWGDVPLEAADDLFSVLCFPLAPCHVLVGGCVVAYPGGSASARARCWLGGYLPG